MKRQAILSIVLALSGAILFFSCRKNAADVPNEKALQAATMISVEEAAAWFKQQQRPALNGRVAEDTIKIGDPDWNRTTNVDLGNGESILKVVLDHIWVVNGYRDLVFKKESNGEMRSQVWEVRADSAYLVKKRLQKGNLDMGVRYFIDNADYTGMILLYNTAGRFIKGRQYLNGQLKYELLPKSTSTITAVSSTMHARVETDDNGGITLPEVVVTAPAPNPPPPPIWLFPPSVPSGPINPPTNPFPYGGGAGSGATTGYNGVSSKKALSNELDKDQNKLIDCATVAAYIKLGSFKVVHQIVVQRLSMLNAADRDFTIQEIQNASGTTVNMDFFAVTIKSLPVINGVQTTAESLLKYIRLNLNDFAKDAPFSPYNSGGYNDTNMWNSANPIGAMLHIEIGMGPLGNDGSVIVSETAADHWIFSTIKTPLDGSHPVSGNRRFGVYKNADGSVLIYTKGVDRITDMGGDWIQRASNIPFSSADQLWESFQDKVKAFVNSHGGNATDKLTLKSRPDWDLVGKVLTGQESIDKLKANGGCE